MRLEQLQMETDEKGFDSFYISFGDLMVILSVFFVMLLSMSKIDVGSFEKIREVMTGRTENTLVELAETLETIINTAPGVPGASVELASDGVRLDIDTGVLFAQGKAVIRDEALDTIQPLLEEIRDTEYRIDVEGHSDDVPYYRIIDDEIITNWSPQRQAGQQRDSPVAAIRLPLPSVCARWAMPIPGPWSTPRASPAENLKKPGTRNRRVSLLIR